MPKQLFKEERLMRILELIHKDKKVIVSELAEIFGLSKPSIRHDLAELESRGLIERIHALGGQPIMYKTGHSLIKAKMKAEGSPLAGEMSGHVFFADRYYGYDDALYAGLRLLEIMSNGVALSTLAARVPAYFSTPEIRIEMSDDRKFEIVEKLNVKDIDHADYERARELLTEADQVKFACVTPSIELRNSAVERTVELVRRTRERVAEETKEAA